MFRLLSTASFLFIEIFVWLNLSISNTVSSASTVIPLSGNNVKHHCSNISGCSFMEGIARCDPDKDTCVCGDGTIEVATVEKTLCVTIVPLGRICDYHEQCIAFDINSNCVEVGGSLKRVCQCRHGYEVESFSQDPLRRCMENPVEQTDPMSLRFGEGSILPIVLSVFAAILVLLALICGIFHLFKWRKKRDQVLSNPDADDSKEINVLSANGDVFQVSSSESPRIRREEDATGFEPVYMMGL
ncbi:uncharacterized protein LOC143240219 [Tachypleus tridentatus]|uniref:uncharacterized protein LOC143240219 n=1 Tax=Tachypleus tridentatus TaxID=6853 RepID=UPI003FD21243